MCEQDCFPHHEGRTVHPLIARLRAERDTAIALLDRERLASMIHDEWTRWASSILKSEPISEARRMRWAGMMVRYDDLPERVKEQDRKWADKVRSADLEKEVKP
ncbi:MAG: hypothetical protein ACYDDZ_06570 [Acidimicrobiales bacterium]